MMDKEPTGKIPNKSSGAGAKPTQALQVRRELLHLNTIPCNTRINRDVSNRKRQRHTNETHQRRHSRKVPFEGDNCGGDNANDAGDEEVGAAPVTVDGECVGEDSPEGFENPWDEVETYVELNG